MRNLNSSPCEICLNRMKGFGFGKIAFSDDNGNIKIHKINEYFTKHKSGIQKKFVDYIKV